MFSEADGEMEHYFYILPLPKCFLPVINYNKSKQTEIILRKVGSIYKKGAKKHEDLFLKR